MTKIPNGRTTRTSDRSTRTKNSRVKTEFDRFHQTYSATFLDLYDATAEYRTTLRTRFNDAYNKEKEGFIRRIEALDVLLSDDDTTQADADTQLQEFLGWIKEITWNMTFPA